MKWYTYSLRIAGEFSINEWRLLALERIEQIIANKIKEDKDVADMQDEDAMTKQLPNLFPGSPSVRRIEAKEAAREENEMKKSGLLPTLKNANLKDWKTGSLTVVTRKPALASDQPDSIRKSA